MPELQSHPVFLDTTVLSNFASTDSIEMLVDVLDSVVVVAAVRDELEEGANHGHEYLERALAFVDAEFEVEAVQDSSTDCIDVREQLDAGEAAALLGARRRNGTIATDDLAARRLAAECDIDVTGSVGLLALGIERNRVSIQQADGWLDTWRQKRGYYAPVDSVADVLD